MAPTPPRGNPRTKGGPTKGYRVSRESSEVAGSASGAHAPALDWQTLAASGRQDTATHETSVRRTRPPHVTATGRRLFPTPDRQREPIWAGASKQPAPALRGAPEQFARADARCRGRRHVRHAPVARPAHLPRARDVQADHCGPDSPTSQAGKRTDACAPQPTFSPHIPSLSRLHLASPPPPPPTPPTPTAIDAAAGPAAAIDGYTPRPVPHPLTRSLGSWRVPPPASSLCCWLLPFASAKTPGGTCVQRPTFGTTQSLHSGPGTLAFDLCTLPRRHRRRRRACSAVVVRRLHHGGRARSPRL